MSNLSQIYSNFSYAATLIDYLDSSILWPKVVKEKASEITSNVAHQAYNKLPSIAKNWLNRSYSPTGIMHSTCSTVGQCWTDFKEMVDNQFGRKSEVPKEKQIIATVKNIAEKKLTLVPVEDTQSKLKQSSIQNETTLISVALSRFSRNLSKILETKPVEETQPPKRFEVYGHAAKTGLNHALKLGTRSLSFLYVPNWFLPEIFLLSSMGHVTQWALFGVYSAALLHAKLKPTNEAPAFFTEKQIEDITQAIEGEYKNIQVMTLEKDSLTEFQKALRGLKSNDVIGEAVSSSANNNNKGTRSKAPSSKGKEVEPSPTPSSNSKAEEKSVTDLPPPPNEVKKPEPPQMTSSSNNKIEEEQVTNPPPTPIEDKKTESAPTSTSLEDKKVEPVQVPSPNSETKEATISETTSKGLEQDDYKQELLLEIQLLGFKIKKAQKDNQEKKVFSLTMEKLNKELELCGNDSEKVFEKYIELHDVQINEAQFLNQPTIILELKKSDYIYLHFVNTKNYQGAQKWLYSQIDLAKSQEAENQLTSKQIENLQKNIDDFYETLRDKAEGATNKAKAYSKMGEDLTEYIKDSLPKIEPENELESAAPDGQNETKEVEEKQESETIKENEPGSPPNGPSEPPGIVSPVKQTIDLNEILG